MLAFGIQMATVLIFFMALSILLFTVLDEVTADLGTRVLGFNSIDRLVATVISINFTFIVALVVVTLYQTFSNPVVQVLRLISSREVPELSLHTALQYHLFLSHIWSSGQVRDASGLHALRRSAAYMCMYMHMCRCASSCTYRTRRPTSSACCSS
jgi:hypothetical protein